MAFISEIEKIKKEKQLWSGELRDLQGRATEIFT